MISWITMVCNWQRDRRTTTIEWRPLWWTENTICALHSCWLCCGVNVDTCPPSMTCRPRKYETWMQIAQTANTIHSIDALSHIPKLMIIWIRLALRLVLYALVCVNCDLWWTASDGREHILCRIHFHPFNLLYFTFLIYFAHELIIRRSMFSLQELRKYIL